MADPDGRRDPRAVAAQRLAEERGSLLVLQVPPLADEALLDPPAGLPRWHGGGGLDNTLHFAEWACGAVESVLPPSVVQQLRDFSEGDGAPALLLRGLGVDGDLEGTLVPAATRGYIKRGQRSETWILGLAMLFGDLLQDAEHLLQGGDPGGVGIGHLVPQREKDGTRGPAGSKVPLNLHRDGPFDDLGTFNYVGPESGQELFLSDKLFLFCNREDAHGDCETFLHDSRWLYEATAEADRELLRNTKFFFDHLGDGSANDDKQMRARLDPDLTGGASRHRCRVSVCLSPVYP